MPCHYGDKCKKDGCKYDHEFICYNAWCKFGFECYNKTTTCKFKHAPGGFPCKYGIECNQKDKNCPFDHSGKVVKAEKKADRSEKKSERSEKKSERSEKKSSDGPNTKSGPSGKTSVWTTVSNSKVKEALAPVPPAGPPAPVEPVQPTPQVMHQAPEPIPIHMLENQIEQEKKILELLKLQDERFELERALQEKHMRRYMEIHNQQYDVQGGLTAEELAFQEQCYQEQEQERVTSV
jgi:hypothetical protein